MHTPDSQSGVKIAARTTEPPYKLETIQLDPGGSRVNLKIIFNSSLQCHDIDTALHVTPKIYR